MDEKDLDGILKNIVAIANHRGEEHPAQAIEYVTLAYNLLNGNPIPPQAGLQRLTKPDVLGVTELKREDNSKNYEDLTAKIRKRIMESSAVFLFSKVPGAHSDYFILAQNGFLDGFLTQHSSKLMRQMPSDSLYGKFETLAYLNDGGLLVPHDTINTILIRNPMTVRDVVEGGSSEPVFFLKYQCRTGQRDGWKRQYDAKWYVATTKELGNEIVQYIQDNPAAAFSLFNGMLGIDMSQSAGKIFIDVDADQRPFTADRNGTLYVVDGSKIKIKNSARSVDFRRVKQGVKMINYNF